MFARIATIFAISTLAAATVLPRTGTPPPPPASQCNTGSLECCNSVQSVSSSPVTLLAGLLGVVLTGITGQAGLTCNPITVIGGGGNSCSAQPVCCTGNNFQGLLVLGCSPVNLNL